MGSNVDSRPSYHDLHITTAQISRTSIFNLPYGLRVMCTRVSGWELWKHLDNPDSQGDVLLAGEYGGFREMACPRC